MSVAYPTVPPEKPSPSPEAALVTTASPTTISGPHEPTPPPQMGPRAGDVLHGKYRLLRPLGEGGMSIVFQAWDQVEQRVLAVKLLRADPRQGPARWKCLQAEAAALARLRHPNVVVAIELSPDHQPPYLVLEWLEGGSVADLLRRHGALAPLLATQIVASAARALSGAHAAGLVHRDVKPSNLLLSARGAVKLADFGLVAEVLPGGQAQPNALWGTPPYFSPEQAWCKPFDHRSDLYSLGATYYELLTGRKPFVADGAANYARLHRDGPVPDPRAAAPGVPESCAAVVRKAMAKEPSGRYADAGEMLAALATAVSHLKARSRELPVW
jgi:serine/threonine-protein kinase